MLNVDRKRSGLNQILPNYSDFVNQIAKKEFDPSPKNIYFPSSDILSKFLDSKNSNDRITKGNQSLSPMKRKGSSKKPEFCLYENSDNRKNVKNEKIKNDVKQTIQSKDQRKDKINDKIIDSALDNDDASQKRKEKNSLNLDKFNVLMGGEIFMKPQTPKKASDIQSTSNLRNNSTSRLSAFVEKPPIGGRKSEIMSLAKVTNSTLCKKSDILEGLDSDEKKLYGNRFVNGFNKLSLLGKGGLGLVWMGESSTKEKFAIKQILKSNLDSTRKELEFGNFFFRNSEKNFSNYAGLNHIIKQISYEITEKDCWIIYEIGGKPLSNFVHQMKGEFVKGERIYTIKPSEFRFQLLSNLNFFRHFIKTIAEILLLLSDNCFIHCDLKPDNILITQTNKAYTYKLIDYGSSFIWREKHNLSNITPEYMPPEVLTEQSKSIPNIEHIYKDSNNWAIDVWSLGIIIVEILEGIPIWLNYKCKIINAKGKEVYKTGLLATKGRDYNKILERQLEIKRKIEKICFNNGVENEDFIDLLEKMLQEEPIRRISPKEILKHDFLL